MKRHILTAVLLGMLCLPVKPQSLSIYTIMHTIETNAVSRLAGHEEWGVESVRQRVWRDMPSNIDLQLVQPSQEVLTANQLYERRSNSALIFGKTYVCDKCPELHVSLIATATPVTIDGICLVNFHMIKPIVQRDAFVPGDSVYFMADRAGQVFPITDILAVSPEEDAAVVKVDTQGEKLDAIPLGEPALVGQHINLISHPKQMVYTYTQGYVTRNSTYDYPGYPTLDHMEISADFAEGSSGGPVMDDRGNLVAMVKGTTSIFYDKERRNPQMVLRVTIPITTLRRLIGLK
ncbi:MAG: trypsin-like peptidase domain-containing protein [Bacteroidales bacterium]|nr:trypsin-like peptidase domain-containing protein [Candidatus Physcousia equi]